MEYTIIKSTRGKKMVVESGHNYKYILAYTSSKNVERWRCSNKICPAKILIEDGKIIKKHGMLQTLIFILKKCVICNIKLL